MKGRIEVGEKTEVRVTAGLGQVLGSSMNRDRIQCFECREYDHFAQECPVRLARQISRETKQIQQLFNVDKDQTLTQSPLMDTDEDELTITLIDNRENLNL